VESRAVSRDVNPTPYGDALKLGGSTDTSVALADILKRECAGEWVRRTGSATAGPREAPLNSAAGQTERIPAVRSSRMLSYRPAVPEPQPENTAAARTMNMTMSRVLVMTLSGRGRAARQRREVARHCVVGLAGGIRALTGR
jgi:hypothetical protein